MLDAALTSAGSGALTYGLQQEIAVTVKSQTQQFAEQVAAFQTAGATANQSQAETTAIMSRANGQAGGAASWSASLDPNPSAPMPPLAMAVPVPGVYSPFPAAPSTPTIGGAAMYFGIGLGVGALAVGGLELAAPFAESLELGPPTLAIGRLGVPALAWTTFGYEYINVSEGWSPALNFELIYNAYVSGYQFYLASEPSFDNMFNAETGELTIYGEELVQLWALGVRRVGNFLIQP